MGERVACQGRSHQENIKRKGAAGKSFRQLFALHPKTTVSQSIWVIKDTFIEIQIQYPSTYRSIVWQHENATQRRTQTQIVQIPRAHMAAINIKKDNRRWGLEKMKNGNCGGLEERFARTCHLNRNQKQNWFKFENVNNTRRHGGQAKRGPNSQGSVIVV